MSQRLNKLSAGVALCTLLLIGCGNSNNLGGESVDVEADRDSTDVGGDAGAGAEPGIQRRSGQAVEPSLAAVTGVKVIAVGDIACLPGETVTTKTCKHRATAKLAAAENPDYVIALGDEQYDSGALSDFNSSYDASWGRFKSITKPTPGNHEYRTSNASGYYRYFENQIPSQAEYYAYNLGTWRAYSLNSNCTKIDCATQADWFRNDLKDHAYRCTLMYMHSPRYSSGGEHGSDTSAPIKDLWSIAYNHHLDVALAAHDHGYERFWRQDAYGHRKADGILSYVSGAGGKSLYQWGNIQQGSQARNNNAFGLLSLTLGKGVWAWEYRTTSGNTFDAGSSSCVGP